MTFELDMWDYLSPLLNDIFQVANQPWLCVALCLQTLYNQIPLLLMVMGGVVDLFSFVPIPHGSSPPTIVSKTTSLVSKGYPILDTDVATSQVIYRTHRSNNRIS